MTTATHKEFAGILGVSPSYITRLGHEGRLVLAADGRIDVAATRRLIEQTGGERPDVAARNAQRRAAGAKKTDGEGQGMGGPEKTPQRPATQALGGDSERIGNSMQAARAVKEKYAALRAKAEYEALIGDLIPREDVDAALRFIGGAVRAALDVLPDQTAPRVVASGDLAECHDTLAQACHDALHGIVAAVDRQKAEIFKAVPAAAISTETRP